jgi:hypothetical protein
MDCNGKNSGKMVTDFLDGNGLAGKHRRSANQESLKAGVGIATLGRKLRYGTVAAVSPPGRA